MCCAFSSAKVLLSRRLSARRRSFEPTGRKKGSAPSTVKATARLLRRLNKKKKCAARKKIFFGQCEASILALNPKPAFVVVEGYARIHREKWRRY